MTVEQKAFYQSINQKEGMEMRRVSNSAVWYLVVCIIMSALMVLPMVHDVIASLGKEKTGSSLVTKDETTKSDTRAKIIEGYGKVPLHFIRNDGQIDKRVKYYEKGPPR